MIINYDHNHVYCTDQCLKRDRLVIPDVKKMMSFSGQASWPK